MANKNLNITQNGKKKKILLIEKYQTEKKDKKFYGKTLKGLNLYDVLVIKNWIFICKLYR